MKLQTAKFPIEDFMKLNSRSVLTTNQCFDILHEFKNTSNWKSTFEKEIPERKVKSIKKQTKSDRSSEIIVEESIKE